MCLLVVAVVTDALRRVAFGVPPTAARLVLFLWVYLAAEVAGVAALATLWVAAGTATAPEARAASVPDPSLPQTAVSG